jgi:NAD(P)-dependent dehydrogenase (short-subunit alcohol dehydrogenase family)
MDLHLNDKSALVTGSTAGLGLEIARKLAVEGAKVIITGRNKAKLGDGSRRCTDLDLHSQSELHSRASQPISPGRLRQPTRSIFLHPCKGRHEASAYCHRRTGARPGDCNHR